MASIGSSNRSNGMPWSVSTTARSRDRWPPIATRVERSPSNATSHGGAMSFTPNVSIANTIGWPLMASDSASRQPDGFLTR